MTSTSRRAQGKDISCVEHYSEPGVPNMRAYMKVLLLMVLSVGLAGQANTQDEHRDDVKEAVKTLDFIADVNKFQGMFDSVVKFCRPHAPKHILKISQGVWLTANQKYLDLRDKELRRVITNAVANGAKRDKIALIEDWAKEKYQSRLNNDRLYKDIVTVEDLEIACSRRLGEMNSSGMQLSSIAPRAAAYLQTVDNPKHSVSPPTPRNE